VDPTRDSFELPPQNYLSPKTLALLDDAQVFDALLELSEAERAWRFRSRRVRGEPLNFRWWPP